MAATYTPIATTTLGSNQASTTFSSIPSTYTDLVLVITAPNTTTLVNQLLQFNGNTSAVYSRTRLLGDGTSASSDRRTNDTYLFAGLVNTTQNNTILHFMNYSNTTTYKTVLTRNNNSQYVSAEVGLFRSTSAISSILIQAEYNSFVAGSTFTLYGIQAA